MTMLKCETNTQKMEVRICSAFRNFFLDTHERRYDATEYQFDFEHGQWYVTEKPTGRSWSVNDGEGAWTYDGFDFEQITDGEEY
jgi:hypothetical protein